MEQKEQFVNISLTELKKLSSKKLTDFDYKLYLYLCRKATFKYQLFGIYQHETYQTLSNAVNRSSDIDKDITQYKRSLTKLEKLELITVQKSKDELIISLDNKSTILDTVKAIENDLKAFSLYPERMKELQKTLGVNIAHAYQNKEKQDNDKLPLSNEVLEKLGW